MTDVTETNSQPMAGGISPGRAPTDSEVTMLQSVQPELEADLGRPVDRFEPVLIATQVVAGTNYFAKVRIGDSEFVHLRVFEPLPMSTTEGGSQQPKLTGMQTEPITHF